MRDRRLVFSRVTSGEADHGVVPLENSQAGSDGRPPTSSFSRLLHIVGEVCWSVSLLGVSGACWSRSDVRTPLAGMRPVYEESSCRRCASCARYGREAARLVAQRGDREDAAIASVGLSRARLAVLAERIQTEKNFTKFAAISTRAPDLELRTRRP